MLALLFWLAVVTALSAALARVVVTGYVRGLRRDERLTLRSAADLLSSAMHDDRVIGRLAGRAVEVRTELRGLGPHRDRVTVVETSLGHHGVELELRPQDAHEVRLIRDGLSVDLILDDPAFDAAFVVEGAPTDVARALLDEKTRRALLELYPVKVVVTEERLHLERLTWLDGAALEKLARVATDLATRAEQALELADETVPTVSATPYRDHVDAAALRQAALVRHDELRALARVRSQRAGRRAVVTGVAVVGGIAVAAVIALLQSW